MNDNKIIEVSEQIEVSLNQSSVFDFHADINNINKVLPNILSIIIERLEYPLKNNSSVLLSVQLFNIISLFKWELTIIEFDKPNKFIDTSTNTLLKNFKHIHSFQPLSQEKTLIVDTICFSPVFMFVDDIIKFFVKYSLKYKLKQTKFYLESYCV